MDRSHLSKVGQVHDLSSPLSYSASAQSPLNRLQIWILNHPQDNLNVEQMASHANMSSRNFARVFTKECRQRLRESQHHVQSFPPCVRSFARRLSRSLQRELI